MSTSETRFEFKYRFPLFFQKESATLCQDLAFQKQHSSRWINNIYFDSVDLINLRNSEAGATKRQKLRLRWYGDTSSSSQAQLELKSKTGHTSNKYVEKILHAKVDACDLDISALSSRLSPYGQFLTQQYPQATLWNRYFRDYYFCSRTGIRITFDSNHEFCNLFLNPFAHRLQKCSSDPLIMEIKCSLENIEEVRKVIQKIPTRQTSFSKYVEFFRASCL